MNCSFGAALGLVAAAAAGAAPFVNESYDVSRLAPGVWVPIAPPPDSDVVQGNSVLVVGAPLPRGRLRSADQERSHPGPRRR
jgi:hypothetical protein